MELESISFTELHEQAPSMLMETSADYNVDEFLILLSLATINNTSDAISAYSNNIITMQ